VDSFEPTIVSLRKWRRKIREWLGSIDKPETSKQYLKKIREVTFIRRKFVSSK